MSAMPIFTGPLEPLLADPEVTAVYIDSDLVRFQRASEMLVSDITFESEMQRRKVINSILSAGGVTLSESNPVVNCELSDGTTVHAEHEPLAMSLHKAS